MEGNSWRNTHFIIITVSMQSKCRQYVGTMENEEYSFHNIIISSSSRQGHYGDKVQKLNGR